MKAIVASSRKILTFRRWMLVALVTLVAASVLYFTCCRHGNKNRPAYSPSWTDIQDLVNANSQWVQYERGGQGLQAIKSGTWQYPRVNEPTPKRDVVLMNAVGARVVVDFLRTLSPAQVEMLKDKLPYSELTPDQQKVLCEGPGYHYHSGVDVRNSYIRVVLRKFGKQPPYADFFWCTKTITGQEILIEDGGNNFYLKDVAKWQQPWN